jgi:hypothetical protein
MRYEKIKGKCGFVGVEALHMYEFHRRSNLRVVPKLFDGILNDHTPNINNLIHQKMRHNAYMMARYR